MATKTPYVLACELSRDLQMSLHDGHVATLAAHLGSTSEPTNEARRLAGLGGEAVRALLPRNRR